MLWTAPQELSNNSDLWIGSFDLDEGKKKTRTVAF